jgi:cell division protein FtsW
VAAQTTTAGRARAGKPDYVILGVVLVLLFVGIVMIYSSSFTLGLADFNNSNYFIYRQILWVAVGLVIMTACMNLDYRMLKPLSPLLMLGAIVSLVLVLIPGIGVTQNGAQRWIQLGPLPPIQPSEAVKLAVIIYIAAWLAAKGEHVRRWSLGFLPFVVMVGFVGGLVLIQPDMGTTLVIVLAACTMFFIGGASIGAVLTLTAGGIVAGMMVISVASYRSERLWAYLHAEDDPAGAGYHILQLLIALGSGGLTGLGLGESRQKFFYVPGAHTDGIFAILAEEAGFIGAVAVVVLFAVLVYRSFKVVFNAQDEFGALLAVGIISWIAYQSILNVGGVTRSIPLTGIPLPFMSYGGSALWATMAGVGLLLSISRYAARDADSERTAPRDKSRRRGKG